jgi:hypothetical protein
MFRTVVVLTMDLCQLLLGIVNPIKWIFEISADGFEKELPEWYPAYLAKMYIHFCGIKTRSLNPTAAGTVVQEIDHEITA